MVHISYGNTRYTGEVMDALLKDPSVGPMGYLAMSKFLGLLAPNQAQRFANRGMQLTTAEDFAKDWRLITDNPASQKAFVRFLEVFPKLDDQKREVVKEVLGETSTKELSKLLDKPHEAGSLETFVASLAPDLWDKQLREMVLGKLREAALGSKYDPEIYAAVVNDVPIPRAPIDHQIKTYASDAPPAQRAIVEQSLIQQAIMHEIVYQAFKNGLDKNYPDLEAQALASDRAKQARQQLRAQGIAEADQPKYILYEPILEHVALDRIDPVPEADLRGYYDSHQNEFNLTGDVVELSMISVPEETPARSGEEQRRHIAEMRKKIAGAADFANMARAHSKNKKAANGGSFGKVPTANLSGSLRKAAMNLKVNEVSEVISQGNMLMLIMITGRERAGKRTFEEARPQIFKKLSMPRMQKAAQAWVKEIQAGMQIQILPRPPKAAKPPVPKPKTQAKPIDPTATAQLPAILAMKPATQIKVATITFKSSNELPVPEELALATIRSKPGGRFIRKKLSDDIKRLYATRKFDDLEASVKIKNDQAYIAFKLTPVADLIPERPWKEALPE
jgi:parvulin-like peptidyl-prolyl isomerase